MVIGVMIGLAFGLLAFFGLYLGAWWVCWRLTKESRIRAIESEIELLRRPRDEASSLITSVQALEQRVRQLELARVKADTVPQPVVVTTMMTEAAPPPTKVPLPAPTPVETPRFLDREPAWPSIHASVSVEPHEPQPAIVRSWLAEPSPVTDNLPAPAPIPVPTTIAPPVELPPTAAAPAIADSAARIAEAVQRTDAAATVEGTR